MAGSPTNPHQPHVLIGLERAVPCLLSTLRAIRVKDAKGHLLAKLTGSDVVVRDVSIATDAYLSFISICPADRSLPWVAALDLDNGLVVSVKLPDGFYVACYDGSSRIEVAVVEAANVPLPSPGGTCTASQLVPGPASTGYTFSSAFYRAAYLDQPLRNVGRACVLVVPPMIGLAPATGPFRAVGVANTGNEVCANSACHYVTPPSYTIHANSSLSIHFGISWWTGANDENGNQLYSPPPCFGAVTDVTRVEVPLASGALTIDLNAAIHIPASSVPWQQVCSAPSSMWIAVEAQAPVASPE